MKPFRLAIPAAVAALAAGCTSYDPQPLGELRLDAYAPSVGDAEVPASTPDSALPKISGEIRLLDAVNLALSQNLALRAAFLMREEATGAIMEAKAAAYPHAGLTGGVTSDLRERGDNPDVYGVSWSVTQPLWRSGAVSAAIRLTTSMFGVPPSRAPSRSTRCRKRAPSASMVFATATGSLLYTVICV